MRVTMCAPSIDVAVQPQQCVGYPVAGADLQSLQISYIATCFFLPNIISIVINFEEEQGYFKI